MEKTQYLCDIDNSIRAAKQQLQLLTESGQSGSQQYEDVQEEIAILEHFRITRVHAQTKTRG